MMRGTRRGWSTRCRSGARLSANAGDEMTYSASEIDGPIDWSSFDVNTQASLTTAADQGFTSIVEADDSRAGELPGHPGAALLGDGGRAPRLRAGAGRPDRSRAAVDDRVRQQLRERLVRRPAHAAGRLGHPRRLAGRDRYVRRAQPDPADRRSGAPGGALLAVAVVAPESEFVQRRESGHATASSCRRRSAARIDSGPLEDVLFMRDEMANLAWAIERTVESPIEQPAQTLRGTRRRPGRTARRSGGRQPAALPAVDAGAAELDSAAAGADSEPRCSRPRRGRSCRASSAAPSCSRTGRSKVHNATGEVLGSLGNQLLYDEEVPREGARITRQRRMARWTDGSTWLWTSFRNQVGQGEGSSQLKFDQVIEPGETR